MSRSPVKELQTHLAKLRLRGVSSSTERRVKSHCETFLRFCRDQDAWSTNLPPDIQILSEYASSLWAKFEAERTVVHKMSTIITFCLWAARNSPPSVVAKYEKLNASQLVTEVLARHPRSR